MPTPARKYNLDGTLLEACSCASPCPCQVGDYPDRGTCSAFSAYHVNHGNVGGVNVTGLSLAGVCQIPGNVRTGTWHVVLYVDDRATADQRAALLAVFTGELGGPPAELAALKQYIAIDDCRIEHRSEGGRSTLRVIDRGSVALDLQRDTQGRSTALHDGRCGTTPGSTAHLSTASEHRVSAPEHGMVWEFTDRYALQGEFNFEA